MNSNSPFSLWERGNSLRLRRNGINHGLPLRQLRRLERRLQLWRLRVDFGDDEADATIPCPYCGREMYKRAALSALRAVRFRRRRPARPLAVVDHPRRRALPVRDLGLGREPITGRQTLQLLAKSLPIVVTRSYNRAGRGFGTRWSICHDHRS